MDELEKIANYALEGDTVKERCGNCRAELEQYNSATLRAYCKTIPLVHRWVTYFILGLAKSKNQNAEKYNSATHILMRRWANKKNIGAFLDNLVKK